MFDLTLSEIVIIVVVLLFRILVVVGVVALVILVVKSLRRRPRLPPPAPPTALPEDGYREPDGYVQGYGNASERPTAPQQSDPPRQH